MNIDTDNIDSLEIQQTVTNSNKLSSYVFKSLKYDFCSFKMQGYI